MVHHSERPLSTVLLIHELAIKCGVVGGWSGISTLCRNGGGSLNLAASPPFCIVRPRCTQFKSIFMKEQAGCNVNDMPLLTYETFGCGSVVDSFDIATL